MSPAFDPLDSAWYAALSLGERVRLLHVDGVDAADPIDGASRDWRVKQWREQHPFTADFWFRQRLESAHLDAETFSAVLAVTTDTLRARSGSAPPWSVSLCNLFGDTRHFVPGELASAGPAIPPFILALVGDAINQLGAELDKLGFSPSRPAIDRPRVLATFGEALANQLYATFGRVIALELHVARLRGSLVGDTPADRFLSFFRLLDGEDNVASLLKEYAVASRLVALQAKQAVGTHAELFQRLSDDWSTIEERFGSGRPLGIVRRVLRSGVGDAHSEGRSVAIIEFASGIRIVYKPRGLAVDAAYYKFLRWLCDIGAGIDLREVLSVDRGCYGWVEFVDPAPCGSLQDVVHYYERLGALLAVLYVLDAQDMHWENIIAAGEQPVLIDLETLFHPVFARHNIFDSASGIKPHGSVSESVEPHILIASSVLRIGILPVRVWIGADGVGVDVSGMGGGGDQFIPGAAIGLSDHGTDDMRAARSSAFIAPKHNLPELGGRTVSGFAHADDVDRGFTAAYDRLASHRHELSASKLLAPFAGVSTRVVVRPTQAYARLLQESLHPDFLRNGLDRDRFLDKLWVGVDTRDELVQLIPFEHDGLNRGDVPLFTTTPDSHDLWSDAGDRISGFFAESGIERVARRGQDLSPSDRDRQRWLIRASISTLTDDPLTVSDGDLELAGPTQRGASVAYGASAVDTQSSLDEGLLGLAHQVAARIASSAIRGRSLTSWLGVTLLDEHQAVTGMTGVDVHGGIPGILLFLSHFAECTGETTYDDLRASGLKTLRGFLNYGTQPLQSLGAYSGNGGLLHVAGRLRIRHEDPEAVEFADKLMTQVTSLIADCGRFDVFGGLAGAIAGLLSYYDASGEARALESAVIAGDRLLTLAFQTDAGMAWMKPARPRGGVGFAFGEAGLAWAFARLCIASAHERFRDAAWLAYSAHQRRSVEIANRTESRERRMSISSYRGAAGIALSASALFECGLDTKGDLVAAVDSILAAGVLRGSHSLCNGTLGSLDVLSHVSTVHPDLSARAGFETLTRAFATEVRGDLWQCGTTLGLETPGLMNGLAGIGCGVLRLISPNSVPCLLALRARSELV